MGYKKKYEQEYAYILDCMEPDNLPSDATPEEKVKNFITTFAEEYSTEWKKQQWPVIVERVEEFLRGLPSSCSVDFETYRMYEVGKEWGVINDGLDTDHLPTILENKETSRFVDKFFGRIAKRIMEMADYYDIEFPRNCYVF